MKTNRAFLVVLTLVSILLFVIASNHASAGFSQGQLQSSILYVKPGATGTLCNSWEDACELPVALDLAAAGDQLWAAAGMYTPSTVDPDPRQATFELKNGVGVYGGFAGTETALEQRQCDSSLTILSGDLLGDDGADFLNNADNSYHVVTGEGLDQTTMMDCLTITGGNSDPLAAGTQREWTDPSQTDLAFLLETQTGHGGGMYLVGSSPTLSNLTFSDNHALYYGSGLINIQSNPTLTGVTFSGNRAEEYGGGGMYNYESDPVLTNVTFSGNYAGWGGGGMFNYGSNPLLTNVTFTLNTANIQAGGLFNQFSSPTITNSILWGNVPPSISDQANSNTTATYSNIELGYPGTGNINIDPLLGPLEENWGATWTHALGFGSPAIEAGDPLNCPATDQRGRPRPFDADENGNALCDMGAYESQYTGRLYAKPGTTGDCSSWTNTCEVQFALVMASPGEEIWAAEGTYLPTDDMDREIAFELKSGVALYGGFVGTETSLVDRDWEAHPTILSADLLGNDGPDFLNNEENSVNVVRATEVDATAILDGFTVRGANYEDNPGGYPNKCLWLGSGICVLEAGPTLTNLIITSNYGSAIGGGASFRNSKSVVSNVTFIGNFATHGGGLFSEGGIESQIEGFSDMVVQNVTFIDNFGAWGGGAEIYSLSSESKYILRNILCINNEAGSGGGLYLHGANISATDISLIGNFAQRSGGGLYTEFGSPYPLLTNMSIIGNVAAEQGGGIRSYRLLHMTNVTISGNTALLGGGVYYANNGGGGQWTNVTISDNTATQTGGGVYSWDELFLNSAIVWGNTPDQHYSDNNALTATYSAIQGEEVYPGIGNINLDPLLGPVADNGGFTMTQALGEDSPAIDAGDQFSCPPTDQRGFPRPIPGIHSGRCDMGAYEVDWLRHRYLPLILK